VSALLALLQKLMWPACVLTYPTLACRELVEKECGVVVQERRAAALELLDKARTFLGWQVRGAVHCAVAFSHSFSGLFDGRASTHK
jgi:hypothetical protein